ncbi:MAG: response regulator, partial [Clostridia bacterium]|nr:response regulator [Clostridia bacterium]
MSAAENRCKSIIMVDDDTTNLTVARNNLAGKYTFFTAPSGAKLFQILEKVTPDLILLDIAMPEMDGFAIIKLLKSTKKTWDIPVIFLTAKIDPESEVKGLDLGAVDYITKPFS